jgi:NAD(P)-dependent dehydrogenase (short-subunit alcohol dehydrogenase family)
MRGIMDRYAELGGGDAQAIRAGVEARHPLGRLGRAEEIAGGIVFLCTPAASFMTGSELVLDGGFTAV